MYKLTYDGASKSNPGIGASAAILYENGVIIDKCAKYFSHTTNNIAEYTGIIIGLKMIISKYPEIKHILIQGDSLLVTKQILGEYKIKNENLKQLHLQIINLLTHFDSFEIKHVYRENNKDADALANLCVLLKKDIN